MVDMLTHLMPLSVLDLGGNNCIENDVVHCIANIHGQNLERLSLNGLDELTSSCLFLLLNKLPCITHIDMSWIRYILLIQDHWTIHCLLN
jgi:hypothetical protein